MARYSKRRILVGGHIAALVAAAPLLFFGSVAGLDGSVGCVDRDRYATGKSNRHKMTFVEPPQRQRLDRVFQVFHSLSVLLRIDSLQVFEGRTQLGVFREQLIAQTRSLIREQRGDFFAPRRFERERIERRVRRTAPGL